MSDLELILGNDHDVLHLGLRLWIFDYAKQKLRHDYRC